MSISLDFDAQAYRSLIGGIPILEAPAPQVHSLEEARSFLRAYGYDSENPQDQERLWYVHSRAVTYLRTRVLENGEEIPERLSDPAKLMDVAHLLVVAAQSEKSEEKRWACVLLKVMHVVTHLQNDLFSYFSSEIQEQIFKPYKTFVTHDPVAGLLLGGQQEDFDPIRLQKIELKPFKDSNSAITKLLAKPEAVAFGLMDKIGVRIVTQSLLDVFRVMQFLVKAHVVSYPHAVPGQTNNSIFPVTLFLKTVDEAKKKGISDPREINELLKAEIEKGIDPSLFLIKKNDFTASSYKFVKFINRQLVKVDMAGNEKPLTFFYPYEVQIMDYDNYLESMTGEASHDEYKGRQRTKARARLFGTGL